MKDKLEFRNKNAFIKMLNKEGIDTEDICLVGSMSLSIRGIREHNDVDVCFKNKNKTSELTLPSGISISKDRHEPLGLSDEELIENNKYHDVIDEMKVVRPEITLRHKQYRNWPKDADDIKLLMEYREDAKEWNEALYQSFGSGSSASLISRGIESFQNDGIATTAIKTAGFFERRYPTISTVRTLLPVQVLKSVSARLSSDQRTFSSAEILADQYYQSEFSAMDIVLRYDILKLISEGKDIFEFHSQQIIGEKNIKKLSKLYNNPEAISETPVRLNHRRHVLNPNEFAAKIWHNIDDHNISISFQKKQPVTYNYFRDYNLPPFSLERLRDKRLELLEKTGSLFYSILWPPSKEYHDEIQSLLENNQSLTVHRSVDIQIEILDKFVYAIYDAQDDTTSRSDIDSKIKKIKPYGKTVRVLAIELPDPKIRDNISLNMEMLKNNIRQKYITKLPESLYYSILHVTDNYGDNIRTKSVLQSYGYEDN